MIRRCTGLSTEPDVLGYVNRDRLVGLTRRLVTIPSITGEEKEIAGFVADRMENLGLEVEVISCDPERPNIVGRFRGNVGGPVLIYNGHMDTFPIGDRSLWTHDPFGARVVNGKMYGRGSQDMKGGLAAMIESFAAIKDAGIELQGDLVLEAVVDEERGGYEGTKRLVDEGIQGDFSVVCEGEQKLNICHKGDYGVELETLGKSAHAAMPERGINAIHKMISVSNALLEIPERFAWERREHELLGSPLINLSVISGGVQRNMVPDRCKMTVDRRIVPKYETLADAKCEIETVIRELEKEDESLKVVIKEIIDVEPAEISQDELLVNALQSAAEKTIDRTLEIGGVKGLTDAHWMVKQLGIPTVSFGTKGGNIHGVDEYLEIRSLVETAEIYTQLAVDLLS